MSSAKPQPARGMRDFLPADVRKREYVIGVIKEVYERYGFEPLETPAVENIETLMGKYGEEGNQLIFKILKRGEHEKTGEADLALRYDLTVPLARFVAQNRQYLQDRNGVFKRYQIQPVWRADRPGRGRFREFYQCDVDVVGSQSMMVEAELIAAANDALVELGFDDFEIRLNHRQVLNGLLSATGIASDKHANALVALDKWEKIGRVGVYKELLQRGIRDDAANRTLGFFDAISHIASDFQLAASVVPLPHKEQIVTSVNETVNAALLNRLRTDLGADKIAQQGLDELNSIIELTKATRSNSRLRIDLRLARGLSYYTAAIMEIRVGGIGSLGGGGRYDDLVQMFLGKDMLMPACGFSLGLERILVVMDEREMFPPSVSMWRAAEVLITFERDAVEELITDGLTLARELRENAIRVDTFPGLKGAGTDYALRRNIPLRIIVRQRERINGEVLITDLRAGFEQRHPVKRDQVVAKIRSLLNETNQPAKPAVYQ